MKDSCDVPMRSFPTLIDAVARHATSIPDSDAVLDGARRLGFAELHERTVRVASRISTLLQGRAAAGVGVLAGNRLEVPEILLGIGLSGNIAVLLNARLPTPQLAQICERNQVQVLFVDGEPGASLQAVPVPTGCVVIQIGGESYEAWLAAAPAGDIHAVDDNSAFLMPFTGGTTGEPKGVLLSHRSRAALYDAMMRYFPCYAEGGRNLTLAPMYHGAGFNFAFASLYAGGAVCLMRRLDPEQFLLQLDREKVTNVSLVPTHLAAVLALGREVIGSKDLSALSAVISNGAPLNDRMKREIISAFGGDVLYDAYGGTEAGIVTVLPPELELADAGVGRPFPGVEVRLFDPDGRHVQEGGCGELFTRSPYQFMGYSGRDSLGPEKWVSGGDIARIDPAGCVHLVGRTGEKVITGGLNVFPREVENALASHAAVSDVVAFGVPDDYWGERITALVQLREGERCTREDLLGHAASSLARYKLPKEIHFVQDLPRSEVGKVQRRAARDAFLVAHRQVEIPPDVDGAPTTQ